MAHLRNFTPRHLRVLTLCPAARLGFRFEKPQQLRRIDPKPRLANRLNTFAQLARVIGLDHTRMDVTVAAHSGRISQPLRDILYGSGDIALSFGLALECGVAQLRQRRHARSRVRKSLALMSILLAAFKYWLTLSESI